MVAVLVVGTIVGLIWADTSDVAGSIAVVTNIVGAVKRAQRSAGVVGGGGDFFDERPPG